MSDEMVRDYLKQDEPGSKWMLLVNPFTRLSGGTALLAALLVVGTTVGVAALGNVSYDGIADLHVGTGAPVQMWRGPGVATHVEPPYAGPAFPAWALAALPVMDWLIVAMLFWVGGALFGSGSRRAIDYFAMSGIGRLPFAIAGLLWVGPAFGRFLPALMQLVVERRMADLTATPGLPCLLVGGVLTMLIMAWGLFLNFFALRESSGMKPNTAVGVYVGVILLGELISKLIAMASFSAGAI